MPESMEFRAKFPAAGNLPAKTNALAALIQSDRKSP
jgi:hypothetical protein